MKMIARIVPPLLVALAATAQTTLPCKIPTPISEDRDLSIPRKSTRTSVPAHLPLEERCDVGKLSDAYSQSNQCAIFDPIKRVEFQEPRNPR